MSSHVDLKIPIRIFELEITTATSDTLGTLDRFILEAIATGVDTFDELIAFFALPEKLMSDACIALIELEHVYIEENSLVVSPQVASLLSEKPRDTWHESLLPTRGGAELTRHGMQLLVSGAVCSYGKHVRDPLLRASTVVPQDMRVVDIDLIEKHHFWTIARQVLTKQDERFVSNVRLVRLTGPAGMAAPVQRNSDLAIRVQLRFAGDIESDTPPQFEVIAPVALPTGVRHRLAGALGEMWLDDDVREEHPGLIEKLERLSPISAPNDDRRGSGFRHYPTMLESADEFSKRIATVENESELTRLHTSLVTFARDARLLHERVARARSRVKLVTEPEAHFSAPMRALEQAKHQVVFVNPWLNRFGSDPLLREAVESALSRGVHVHLLWGIERQKDLPDQELPAFDWFEALALQRQAEGHGVLWMDLARVAHVHAKVIVCDGDWALVGSANFLNKMTLDSTLEVSVEIRHEDAVATRMPGPILDILGWIRSRIPDYRYRRALFVAAHDLGLEPLVEPRELDAIPELSSRDVFANYGFERVQNAWKREWDAELARLTELREFSGATARLVRTGAEHLEWMLWGIRNARQRLCIASDGFRHRVLTDQVVDALVDARSRGVEVVVLHGQPPRDTIDDMIEGRLDALREAKVRFVHQQTHAKFLLVDDGVLVSSFNFLSRGAKGSAEAGMWVRGNRLAEQLWEIVSSLETGAD